MWLGTFALVLGLAGAALTAEQPGPAAVDVLVTTNKDTYRSGEPILISVQIVNRGREPVVLGFSTTQRYDVLIEDMQGRHVWRWSDGRMFAQVLGTETLEPSGRIDYHVSVRERLSPGHYKVSGIVPAGEQRRSPPATIKVE